MDLDKRKVMRKRHARVAAYDDRLCDECHGYRPCEVNRLLDLLDAAEHDRDEANNKADRQTERIGKLTLELEDMRQRAERAEKERYGFNNTAVLYRNAYEREKARLADCLTRMQAMEEALQWIVAEANKKGAGSWELLGIYDKARAVMEEKK